MVQKQKKRCQLGATIALTLGVMLSMTTAPWSAQAAVEDKDLTTYRNRIGSLAFVTQGSDLIMGHSVDAAYDATSIDPTKWAFFSTLSGGMSTYDMGSDVDVDGFGGLLGVARNISMANSNVVVGAFLEAAWGSVDSRHVTFRDKNDTHYWGGGLLARYNSSVGFHGTVAARVGQLGNEIKLENNGVKVSSHNNNSTYYGASFELGYSFFFGEASMLDAYGNINWNQVGKYSTTLEGKHYQFDDISSLRSRLGARYSLDLWENVEPFIGAAWEYEFDGDAKGVVGAGVNKVHIGAKDGSAKGSTGLLEIGASFDFPTRFPICLELSATGYIGQRKGFTGGAELVVAF